MCTNAKLAQIVIRKSSGDNLYSYRLSTQEVVGSQLAGQAFLVVCRCDKLPVHVPRKKALGVANRCTCTTQDERGDTQVLTAS